MGASLVSGPTIRIRATWEASYGTATSGTLGADRKQRQPVAEYFGHRAGFWYGNALANALSGEDQNGLTGPNSHEMNARFNVDLGKPGCLETAHWYYGLDNNHGANGIDLVSVLLHEFGHGLGFQTFTNRTTGEQIGDDTNGRFPSIYDRYLFDNTANKSWPQMTNAEMGFSNQHWKFSLVGPQVLADAPNVLSGTPRLESILRQRLPEFTR